MRKKILIIGAVVIVLAYGVLAPGLVGLALERWARDRLAEFQPDPEYTLSRDWRRSRLEVRLADGSTLVAHARHASLKPPALAAFQGILMLAGQAEPVTLSGHLNWRGNLSLSAESEALAWAGGDWSISGERVAARIVQGPAMELRVTAGRLVQARGTGNTLALDNPALHLRWQKSDDRARFAATLVATRPDQPESHLELALDNILLEPLGTIAATLSALARDDRGRINPEWASLILASAWSELQLGGLELEKLALALDDAFHLSGRWRFDGPSVDNRIGGSGARQALTDWAIPITTLATGQDIPLATRTVEQTLADLAAAGMMRVDGDTVTVQVTND